MFNELILMFRSELSFMKIGYANNTLKILDFESLNFDFNVIFEHVLLKLCCKEISSFINLFKDF